MTSNTHALSSTNSTSPTTPASPASPLVPASPASAASAAPADWSALVSAALLGTERRTPPVAMRAGQDGAAADRKSVV